MNFNYPDLLSSSNKLDQFKPPPNSDMNIVNIAGATRQVNSRESDNNDNNEGNGSNQMESGMNKGINEIMSNGMNSNMNSGINNGMNTNGNSDFNSILFNRLSSWEDSSNHAASKSPNSDGYRDIGFNTFSNSQFPSQLYTQRDTFNLPLELQGGIGNISSRRPSYAAESFTRAAALPSQQPQEQQAPLFKQSQNLTSFAVLNNFNQTSNQYQNFNLDQLNDSFTNFNLNSNLNDFQARRPSQLVDFNQPVLNIAPSFAPPPPQQQPQPQSLYNQSIKLENGLILKDQYIMASLDLKKLYYKTVKYFQNPELSNQILSKLNNLLNDPTITKLIQFIKTLNNLTFNHKILCLVVNKNGKYDLLSYPNNSNIFLQKNDLVIVDGDRGKDLVMILEPLVSLNFAILFNFLKKLEHLKSLTIFDDSQNKPGTHSTLLNASSIINNHSNEDNEFIITLPTKQVLRFATPKEVHKISGKFLEEKKAFITCFNKIKELNLQNDLRLINVEYQSDFKKLIFYYFANFKRIDFRGLIKELFKIYKTRIWLCAVLPYDKPELYINQDETKVTSNVNDSCAINKSSPNSIPREYELSNEQILNFSINEFDNLSSPDYFHSINLLNLIQYLSNEIKGNFYGFNNMNPVIDDSNITNNNSNNNKDTNKNTDITGSYNITTNNNSNNNNINNINNTSNNNTNVNNKIIPSFNPFND